MGVDSFCGAVSGRPKISLEDARKIRAFGAICPTASSNRAVPRPVTSPVWVGSDHDAATEDWAARW